MVVKYTINFVLCRTFVFMILLCILITYKAYFINYDVNDAYLYNNVNCIDSFSTKNFYKYFIKNKKGDFDVHYNIKILIYNNFIIGENCLKYLVSTWSSFEINQGYPKIVFEYVVYDLMKIPSYMEIVFNIRLLCK